MRIMFLLLELPFQAKKCTAHHVSDFFLGMLYIDGTSATENQMSCSHDYTTVFMSFAVIFPLHVSTENTGPCMA